MDYKKIVEGKQILFLIPVTDIDNGSVYLDVTRLAKNAINKDRRNFYDSENGPNFFIEIQRASEYAEYIRECGVTSYNYHKFNTRRGYSLFIQSDV